MTKENLKTEKGRSMVEMLGVLAIIGVLTIIGITGFRYALNKHYANQTVERLMRRAVVLAGQANFGQNPSLHEFDENDGEYPISRTLKSTSESFTMRVDNVPQEVCQQIVGMEWKLAKIIPENCSDETMEFMFLDDLTDCTECQPETFPCEDYGNECGKCSVVKGFFPDEGNQCTDDEKPYCVLGKCEPCPAGQTTYNGNCKACSQINATILADPEDCHKCVDSSNNPTHWLMYLQGNSYCIQCSYNENRWATTIDECRRCSNRCLTRSNDRCVIPGTSGAEAYVRNNETGYCDCAEGYYLGAGSKPRCFHCSDMFYATELENSADCHKCIDSEGHSTHWIMYQQGIEYCVSCSCETNLWSTNIDECRRCSNRCLASNGTCQIYGSGQTYTGKDDDGYCTN